MRIVIGIFSGLALSGAFGYLLGGVILDADTAVALIVAAICGAFGAVYSAIAFHKRVYQAGFFSILGYVIDVTWSILNTFAGFVVWAPVCLITGARMLETDEYSRRSGSFVYDKNPRGDGYAATTVGTVIAGGWCSHEEVHVWQARIFGPTYLVGYGLAFIMMALSRLLTFRPAQLVFQAYERICFEDWAYWGGGISGSTISWGGWFGGFFATVLFMGLALMIPIGAAMDELAVLLIGIGGLVVYGIVRALLPAGH